METETTEQQYIGTAYHVTFDYGSGTYVKTTWEPPHRVTFGEDKIEQKNVQMRIDEIQRVGVIFKSGFSRYFSFDFKNEGKNTKS